MCNTCGNKAHDDLNDDLDLEMFGTEAHMLAVFREDFGLSGETKPGYDPATDPALLDQLHYETCKKCRGTGRFVRGYTFSGQCFACKGKGKIGYKTAPEVRASARDAAAQKKRLAFAAFMKDHESELRWMIDRTPTFGFAKSMLEAATKYGYLTERQLEAVRKCMTQDALRDERIATDKAERAVAARSAPVIDVSVIETAFAHALERGVKKPKLRLDTFHFSLAPATGSNAGAIYVKEIESGEYLGKVMGGKFMRVRSCTPEQEARIIAAASDPGAAAKAYGQRTGTCSICGRKLTKGESVDRMMGPICADNYGF
jgi:hypothetical protein